MELIHSNGIYIPHLSASTINKFITSRFDFYQSKIANAPFKGSEFTARGKAVEHAVNQWIEGNDSDPIEVALKAFDEEAREIGLNSFEVEETRNAIPGLVNLAFEVYRPEFGTRPAVTQRKITLNLEGVGREIVGYLDFFQEGYKVRDCKVVNRTPSKLSQPYVLQGALYRKATGLGVVFDFFVNNKKPAYKEVELTDDEYLFGISYLTRAAQVIEELESCDNPKRIIELMSFPDLSSLWTRSDMVEAAKTWNIVLK